MPTQKIHPVILCGGSGSRLWPASRASLPKQFLALNGPRTLFQNCLQLAHEISQGTVAPMILANADHGHLITQQADAADMAIGTTLFEPEGRNTAPALALAALVQAETDPSALMMVLSSDHWIPDADPLLEVLPAAAQAAEQGAIVTFGLATQRPETGYGYIAAGQPVGRDFRVRKAKSFIEKPAARLAEELHDDPATYWNAGLFLFRADRLITALEMHAPDIVLNCRLALAACRRETDAVYPDADRFAVCRELSIDYAVMEKDAHVAVVPVHLQWSDLGAWQAVQEVSDKDEDGNVHHAEVYSAQCKNVLVQGGDRLVATLGLEDLVIVDTPDALLVARQDMSAEIKQCVADLKDADRPEVDLPARVQRPWGSYQSVHQGDQHQVKNITVAPGGELSLQYHHHRAEHWIVVSGIADVLVGEEVKHLKANDSVYIPQGAVHRLANPGTEPLELIEVQFGHYLGEDDIVRLDDRYGRVEEIQPVSRIAAE